MNEPKLVDPDDPWGDQPKKGLYKWQTPKPGSLQAKMLKAVGRTHYQNRNEQSRVNEVAKSCLSLQSGKVSQYPLEWVEFCISWTITQRTQKKRPIQLNGLLNFINDADKRTVWVDKNMKTFEPPPDDEHDRPKDFRRFIR